MVYVRTTNNMKIRSVQEIALKASHETAELYSVPLYTGNIMHSYICYELSIYNELIRRVEELSTNEGEKKKKRRDTPF